MTKLKKIINAILKRFKQKGIKGVFIACKNYIKYGKAVVDEYAEYIDVNEPNEKMLDIERKMTTCLNISFGIIADEKEEVLNNSIRNQTYSNWQIIKKDEILNTNCDYIVFLGKNIELAKFALYDIIKTIEGKDGIAFYSDNDQKINGQRVNPAFKPDFAIDTILSRNYIGDLLVVKTKFFKYYPEILKNLNRDFIYDLVLKISEKTNQIIHIPRILYHYLNQDKSINTDNQKDIIKQYLNRNKIAFKEVKDGLFEGDYKIEYEILENSKVSIVVPNKDHIEDLQKLIESIKKSTYTNYEIIIVENNSENQETFDYYEKIQKEDSRIKVEKFEINYFNYSSIVNFGVEKSTGEYIILLNNDIEILTPDWIEQMLMYVQKKDVGICGIKLYFPDRSIQHAGVTIGIRGLAGHRYREVKEEEFKKEDYINIVQDLSAVTAACFMVRKNLFNELLGFDEKLAVAFNDVDFCLKVRKKGLKIVYNPFAFAYHYESKSRGEDTENTEKQQRFAREYNIFVFRWQEIINRGDPYYNPNYRLDVDIPQINYNKI